MKTKILISVTIIFMVVGLQAQPAFNRGIRGQQQMKSRIEALKKSLNLTDDQKEALKKMRFAMSKELIPLRNTVGELTAHLKTLTSIDKPDMGAINQSLEKIGNQKTEIAKVELKYRMQMRSIFTEEQLMKLQGIKARMKQFRMHRMKNNGR